MRNARTFATIVAVLTILISGTWQRVNYYSYPDRLETQNSRSLSNYSISLFGEYLPADGPLLAPDPASSAVFSEWKSTIDGFVQTANSNAQCTLIRITPIGESRGVTFTATCGEPSLVTIPIFATSAHSVAASRPGVDNACVVSQSSQSLCVIRLPEGITDVTVQMPTFISVLKSLLRF